MRQQPGFSPLLCVRTGSLSLAMATALLLAAPRPHDAVATLTTGELRKHAAPDAALLAVATLLAWTLLAWLAAGLIVVAAGQLPGVTGRCADAVATRLLPSGLRRALGVVLGIGLVLGAVTPAASAGTGTGTSPPSGPRSDRPAAALNLDWPVPAAPSAAAILSRSAVATRPTAVRPGPAAVQPAAAVLVRPGDTLWSLADRALVLAGDQKPSNAAIAAAWPAWWAANRQVVGENPDLIYPGVSLTTPAAPTER